MIKTFNLFGDSILKGVTLPKGHSRYKLCKLDYDFLEDYSITLENHSRMGHTIDKGIEIVDYIFPQLNSDSFVIIEFGGNDCNYDWSKVSENPNGVFSPFTPADDFLKKYIKAINKIKSSGAFIAVATLPPLDSEKFFNWITKGLDSKAILTWLGDKHMLGRWQGYYNSLAMRAAAETNVPIIDIHAEFLKSHCYNDLLCEDGIHPTKKGCDLITEKFNSFLKEHLFRCDGYNKRKIC